MAVLEKGISLFTVGALVAAGVGAYEIYENCLKDGRLAHCIEHIYNPKKPDQAKIGGLAIAGELVTGNASVETFGEVQAQVKGWATFDYDENWLAGSPGVDRTLFFNRDHSKTATVTFNPCIRLSDNYKNTKLDIPYKVEPGPNGTIKDVIVDAGSIDACFPRFDSGNELLWSTSHCTPVLCNNQGIPDTLSNTAHKVVNDLWVSFVQQDSCPQNGVNVPAVKDEIASRVVGDIVTQHKALSGMVEAAYDAGKKASYAAGSQFVVNLAEQSSSQPEYQNAFNQELTTVRGMRRTFPDVKGDSDKMAPPQVQTPALSNCNVIQPMNVAAQH